MEFARAFFAGTVVAPATYISAAPATAGFGIRANIIVPAAYFYRLAVNKRVRYFIPCTFIN